uniref:Uncharacterized protein n=1 Tax=Panagrolaimus davidi TaxID=227884 RepID=A0A914QLK0_9BILA
MFKYMKNPSVVVHQKQVFIEENVVVNEGAASSISGSASNLLHPDFVAPGGAPSIDRSLEENSFEDDDHSIGDSSASSNSSSTSYDSDRASVASADGIASDGHDDALVADNSNKSARSIMTAGDNCKFGGCHFLHSEINLGTNNSCRNCTFVDVQNAVALGNVISSVD